MKKSILILGIAGSGKSTLLNTLVEESPTEHVLDGATSISEIVSILLSALWNKSYCIIASQMLQDEIPDYILPYLEVQICDTVR